MAPDVVIVAEPRNDSAKTTWAIGVGVAIDAVSFAIGAALVGSDPTGLDQAKAGWITCSGGFTLGPFVAHAMTGQWLRGLAFSAAPLAGTIGNAIVLGAQTQTIDQMVLNPDQRLVYVFTSVGLLGSVIGLLDVALFKHVRVAPTLSHGGGGFVVGGSF
jgi:hypothetical protein